MCGISGVELLVIIVAAIIFLGPEKLPEVMGALGRFARDLRRMKGDLGEMTRELRSNSGLDELKRDVGQELGDLRVRERVKEAESEIDAIRARLKRPLQIPDAPTSHPSLAGASTDRPTPTATSPSSENPQPAAGAPEFVDDPRRTRSAAAAAVLAGEGEDAVAPVAQGPPPLRNPLRDPRLAQLAAAAERAARPVDGDEAPATAVEADRPDTKPTTGETEA